MCNITNQMIQECIYNAVTNHFLRQIVLFFFGARTTLYYTVYQCSSVGRPAQTTGYEVITIFTCIYIYPISTDRVAFSQACVVIRKIIYITFTGLICFSERTVD